jgi:nucleoside-diphosphate-sugar epimerase
MRACVTGGSGFIGWYLCHALAEAGHEITILDLHEPGDDLPPHRFVKGDIRNPEALRAAFRDCEAVYNLAAAHHDFGIAEKTYDDVNRAGTQAICDVCDELGIKRICFYSTVAVYGDAPEPLTEETEPQPNSPYGATKLLGEQVLEAWTGKGDGRRCLVIRPTVTFGPRNFANMYSLIRQIEGGKFVWIGPGSNIKSLSYVENIIEATLYLEGLEGRPAFDVYNWVEKPDFSSRKIAETIFDAIGKKPPRWSFPMWMALIAALPFDVVIAVTGKNIPISSARIKKLFTVQTKFESDKVRAAGFEPAISLDDGIARMVKWYRNGGKDESAEWRQPPAEPVKTVDEARTQA